MGAKDRTPVDQLIEAEQTALLLGINLSRVYQLAREGRLPRVTGRSRAKTGPRRVMLFDILKIKQLAERRAAFPPRPGMPRLSPTRGSATPTPQLMEATK